MKSSFVDYLELILATDLSHCGPADGKLRSPEQEAYTQQFLNHLKTIEQHTIDTANAAIKRNPKEYTTGRFDEQSYKNCIVTRELEAQNIIFKQCDFDKLIQLEAWLNNLSSRQGFNLFSSEPGLNFTNVKAVLLNYQKQQHLQLIDNIIDTFAALNMRTAQLEQLRNGYEKEVVTLLTINQTPLLTKLSPTPPKTFGQLIRAADEQLKAHLTMTEKGARKNNTIEMDLSDLDTAETESTHLKELAKHADQLVKDAKRRFSDRPDELPLAAHIRLVINSQHVKPLPPEQFHQKLTPLLKKAEKTFAQRRHAKAWNIIKDILKIASLIGLVKETKHFMNTGKVRLFNFNTRASRTVNRLVESLNTTMRCT
ncbi:MAG: hypothetical protein KDH94_04095 [Coxiellaceae bacterium]|nr:hypothetical protein [Coxiellaceae bacterium]